MGTKEIGNGSFSNSDFYRKGHSIGNVRIKGRFKLIYQVMRIEFSLQTIQFDLVSCISGFFCKSLAPNSFLNAQKLKEIAVLYPE